MSNLLPLLSKGFRKILIELNEAHDSKIGKHLFRADTLIEGWNKMAPSGPFKTLLHGNDDNAFWEIWEELNSREINSLINESVRMLDIRTISPTTDEGEESTFEVSFLPKGKQPEYNEQGKWARKNRQTGKPTRIIKRLINSKEFVDADYEIFNNQLKAIVDQQGEFRVVKGDDIAYWYHHEQYAKQSGSLGSSCMKHGECQSYFEIYKKYAKMLVLIKNEKLLGRAVIWEIDDAVYMDRVYVCMDYLIEAFIQYAQDHKWYYRQHQSLLSDGDEVEWLSPEDDYQEADTIDLEIEIHGIEEVPYMDSFRYFNQEANCITTVQNDDYDYLSSTDGSFGNRITETCPVCGSSETFNPDDGPSGMCWSEIDDCWYCEDCCVYSQTLDTYIRESRAVEVRMSRRFNDWIPEDDLSEEDLYVEIDGRWYSVDHDDVMFNEKTEEYYI